MKDFLNNVLEIGDNVIYINSKEGFSLAKIVGFTKDMLILKDDADSEFKKTPKKVIKHVIF